jgi:hypothetical protein
VRRQAGRDLEPAPLAAIQFLVDAAAIDAPVETEGRNARFDERALWAIGLFERIEERNRTSSSFVGAGQRRTSALSGWRQ